MDLKAMYKLTYGLYILSSKDGSERSGCIVNTLSQVTSSPVQLSVTVSKENYTEKLIERSGRFAAVALTQSADLELIGAFGFRSGRDADKFAAFDVKTDAAGVPYITEKAAAFFSCRVVRSIDLGTHMMFIAEAEEMEPLSDEEVLTYAYYQKVKKGGTPKNAPSYKGEEKPETGKAKGFRCSVCGYILEADELPADFVCPVCGQGADRFVPLSEGE